MGVLYLFPVLMMHSSPITLDFKSHCSLPLDPTTCGSCVIWVHLSISNGLKLIPSHGQISVIWVLPQIQQSVKFNSLLILSTRSINNFSPQEYLNNLFLVLLVVFLLPGLPIHFGLFHTGSKARYLLRGIPQVGVVYKKQYFLQANRLSHLLDRCLIGSY